MRLLGIIALLLVTIGAPRAFAGSGANAIVFSDPTAVVDWYDDFLGGGNAGGTGNGDHGWVTGTGNPAGATCGGSNGSITTGNDQNHLGVFGLQAGATNGNVCQLCATSTTGTYGITPTVGGWKIVTTLKLQVADATMHAWGGLADSQSILDPPASTAGDAGGVAVVYYNGTHWVGHTCQGGTCATDTAALDGSGCTLDTNWHRYTISMNAAATTLTYQCDTATAQTQTVDLPTGRSAPHFGAVDVTAAATRTLYVDLFWLHLPVTR